MDNLPECWQIDLFNSLFWPTINRFQWIFGQPITHDKAAGVGTNDKHVIGRQCTESLMLIASQFTDIANAEMLTGAFGQVLNQLRHVRGLVVEKRRSFGCRFSLDQVVCRCHGQAVCKYLCISQVFNVVQRVVAAQFEQWWEFSLSSCCTF